jgi:hypothetical protein
MFVNFELLFFIRPFTCNCQSQCGLQTKTVGDPRVDGLFVLCYPAACRLGGVVVSVLATGPKGCEFQSNQGD